MGAFVHELALFAGAGGGILGGKLLGWRTVCAVEWEPYPASVLAARQNDKILPSFPIWDDVQTFDGKPWRGIVDVVSGGFPCQDISTAGKGDGLDGERSGMWREMARIIGEVRPTYAFVENSPMLVTRGLERVLADLTKMGYDSRWGVISAADIGANHRRERIWIVGKTQSAYTNLQPTYAEQECKYERSEKSSRGGRRQMGTSNAETEIADSEIVFSNGSNIDRQRRSIPKFGNCCCSYGQNDSWWQTEPDVGRVADGVDARVDRLKAIGNGQVPLCAATAWRILSA